MINLRNYLPLRSVTPLALTLLLPAVVARADGVYLNGIGARSMSMGGADAAYAADPLGAMGSNPAGLGFLTAPGLEAGFVGGMPQGSFSKPPVSSGHLRDDIDAAPEAAFAYPIGKLCLGASVAPMAALDANWTYTDPPGGANGKTSYGLQTDHSEIYVLRSAAGLGYAFTPHFSFGASFGVDYNRNELQTPYIFQSQPVVKGAKTLLHLKTDGFGFDGQAGFLFKPLPQLQLGLTYQSPFQVKTHGSASGNVGPQFGVANIPFSYDAQVRNKFPQQITGGVSWKFHPQWRAAAQVEWVDWADAFTTLPVRLSSGSSSTVNGVVGSSSLADNIPLNWRSEFVYRVGLEYEVIPSLFLRAGYCYGSDPVPGSTLTPLTAAIMENTFTFGVGYQWKKLNADLAYQYDIPVTRGVGTSGLLSGEYSNSSVDVSVHWVGLTIGYTF